MGRKKATPDTGEVNPLQRMLGTYLRMERTKLGYSSGDVSHRLGLSDTYYRLVESGRAALNQSLVFKIIAAFANTAAPTHESSTISFEQLAKYLVGSHWVGAEMAARQRRRGAEHAMEDLALFVSDFQVFHERTKGYFNVREQSDEERRFLEDVAAPAVGEFLSSGTYGIGYKTDRDFLRIGELPTLNIDILLELKQSLSGRPFVHTAEIAAKWEFDRRAQFRNHRGLFSTAAPVVTEGNLGLFHQEYLKEPRFAESRILFIESRGESETRRDFINFLNRGRARHGVRHLTQDEKRKLSIICLSDDERRRFQGEVEDILSRDSTLHQAYWGFETTTGLQISFIGLHNGNSENVRNLALAESERKVNLFDKLWSSVYAYRQD
jgi:transcriptional regulator with XRE-family HTH domain